MPGFESRQSVSVREVSEGDLEDLLELHRLEGWPFSESAFRRWLSGGRWSRVLVAEAGGRVVGKVTVDLAYRPYSEVVNLLVHPSFRGRGVGGALLDAALRLAEGEGFWAQLVMTDPRNEPAARLYRSRGFLPAISPAGGTEGYCWLIRFSRESPPGSSSPSDPARASAGGVGSKAALCTGSPGSTPPATGSTWS